MTSITSTDFETQLQWQGERRGLLSTEQAPAVPLGDGNGGQTPVHQWSPEELLLAAVEGRTLVAFLEQARARAIEILFYQSTAFGRRVEFPGSPPHFTDLIVRPRVAVRSEEEVAQVLSIFAALPSELFPSSILRLMPRIEPVVEVWFTERPSERGHSAPPPSGWQPASVTPHGS